MFRIGLSLVCLLSFSCGKDSKDDPAANLPVANSWNGQATGGDMALSAGADPHAGLDMGGASDPHAGLNMGGASDPHAGLDMGAGADPHAGLDMGEGGGNPGGLQAPDPNRTVDPSMFLAGQITAAKNTAGLIKPGSVVFLSVRPVNKATGESLGAPLAVERLDLQSLPVAFHLSGENTMVAGTAFEGDVMVYARVDSDGEASSKLPGDVEGSVMASIPADGLALVLNTVVP